MKTHEADILVVGAGLAGLAAAQHLTDAGLTVTVLEPNAVHAATLSRFHLDPQRKGRLSAAILVELPRIETGAEMGLTRWKR